MKLILTLLEDVITPAQLEAALIVIRLHINKQDRLKVGHHMREGFSIDVEPVELEGETSPIPTLEEQDGLTHEEAINIIKGIAYYNAGKLLNFHKAYIDSVSHCQLNVQRPSPDLITIQYNEEDLQ